MIRIFKSPIKKAPRTSLDAKAIQATPQRKVKKISHNRYGSSTPVPFRSPSPTKDKNDLKKPVLKPSNAKLGLVKVDLRKGIFSKKQSFEDGVEKLVVSTNRTGDTPALSKRSNKYQSLSKEFKIDKIGLKNKDFRDNQGFYIPDQPPMMYEEINKL